MEQFIVMTEQGPRGIFTEYKKAIEAAKQIKGAWVEARGGDEDGEVLWQARG